jgi:ubiquinone/menaquinone biosynthesis C-methylase UbiE
MLVKIKHWASSKQVFKIPYYILKLITKTLVYSNFDSTSYWKSRAKENGEAAVLWKNQEYNSLYRKIQKKVITHFIPQELKEPFHVLDVGCGIGVISKMVADYHPLIHVDAVDYPEMIKIARNKYKSDSINYVESSAEEYFQPDKKYDLVISSSCFSVIRNIEKLKQAVSNSVRMLKEDGIILMMDPFHRWKYLARVKFSSGDIQKYMKGLGFHIVYKSGALFWPYRVWLADSDYSGIKLEKRFRQGEWFLSKLGRHLWADHKILAFKR